MRLDGIQIGEFLTEQITSCDLRGWSVECLDCEDELVG